MTNIGTMNYSDLIRQAISGRNKKNAPETDGAAESSFGAMFLGFNVESEIVEINVDISENETSVSMSRWTSSQLYTIDIDTLEGYRVNKNALDKVRDKLAEEGIDADRRTPTHEITDEQMEWLGSRYDLDFLNACSFEHPEYGNFMLDLAYLNVFSLDEVENMYGVLPFNANHKGYLHMYDENSSGYVISGNFFGDEDLYTQLIMEYIKAKYTGKTDEEYERMTEDYIAQREERMSVLKDFFARVAENKTDNADLTRPPIENAAARLIEDFGGLGKAETATEKLFKSAPDKWVTEAGIAHNAAKAAMKFRENVLGIKDTEPTHELTDEQREWLYSRHDFSTMKMYVRSSYDYGGTTQYRTKATAEYSNFVADLVYLGVYSADEFIQVSPLDTRAGAGSTLTEYFNKVLDSDGGLSEHAKLFVEHLQNMFNFYDERSKDPFKAAEGDAEFAELIRERYLPFHQQFFEFIDELIGNYNERLPNSGGAA